MFVKYFEAYNRKKSVADPGISKLGARSWGAVELVGSGNYFNAPSHIPYMSLQLVQRIKYLLYT